MGAARFYYAFHSIFLLWWSRPYFVYTMHNSSHIRYKMYIKQPRSLLLFVVTVHRVGSYWHKSLWNRCIKYIVGNCLFNSLKEGEGIKLCNKKKCSSMYNGTWRNKLIYKCCAMETNGNLDVLYQFMVQYSDISLNSIVIRFPSFHVNNLSHQTTWYEGLKLSLIANSGI